MSNSPNPSRPRYQKIRELGHNRAGGRVTYLAKDNVTGKQVVIKQFQFTQSGADWLAYKAYEREIQVLQGFNHPGIPRYLNSFQTPTGFCMVQEYKKAQSLGVTKQWTPQEVKQIAISVLEILIYLQNRIPPVIHRDIKPENILVDAQLNIYLVDFGLARIAGGETAMSSVAAGTFGFMAPEQIYNRDLSNATDLYGLGATLICLLTGTKSTAIETLTDDTGRINFKSHLSQLNRSFVDWLEKMVQPKQKDRYTSADAAKEALIPLSLTVVPEVNISHSNLKFKATKLGDKLTQTITVSNSIPKTILKGKWTVVPHPKNPSDTPDSHAWISFSTDSFQANQVECSITVDTSNLMADKVYNRQILLETNSEPKNHSLMIEVHSGKIPIGTKAQLYFSFIFGILLSGLFSIVFLTSVLGISRFIIFINDFSPVRGSDDSGVRVILLIVVGIGTIFWFGIGYLIGLYQGLISIAVSIPSSYLFLGLAMPLSGFGSMPRGRQNFWEINFLPAILCLLIITSSFTILGSIVGFLVKDYRQAGFSKKFSFVSAGITIVLGASLVFLLIPFELINPFFKLWVAIFILIGTFVFASYLSRERKNLMAKYRQSERHRIKP